MLASRAATRYAKNYTKNPTNFTAMKAIFSRPITAGVVISCQLLACQATI